MNNVVKFDNKDIYVTDIDGVKVVGLRSILRNIGMIESKANSTIRRMKGDYVLSKGLYQDVLLDSDGGAQSMVGINIEYLPIAVAKISITPTMKKEDPIICEKLAMYQLECAKALRDHFGIESKGAIEKEQQLILETFAEQSKRLEFSEDGLDAIGHDLSEVKQTTNGVHTLALSLENRITELEVLHNYPNREKVARLTERWKIVIKNYLPHLFTSRQGNCGGKIGFYGAIEDRFNFKFKSGCTKSYEVTNQVPIEDLEDFIMNIGTKYLLSEGGFWYNSIDASVDKYDLKKMEHYFREKDKNGGDIGNLHTTNCYICGEKLKGKQYTLEHAIAKGNHVGDRIPYTNLLDNLAPTGYWKTHQCECNKIKGWEHDVKWMNEQGFMSKARYKRYLQWRELMRPRREDDVIISNNFKKTLEG